MAAIFPMPINYMRARWTRISTSILISFFLWFSVKLVRTYETDMDVSMKYEQVPSELKLREDLPSQLNLKVSGSGQHLILHIGYSCFHTLSSDVQRR